MTYLWKRKHDSAGNDENLVQIKCKLDSEFRRFSIPKPRNLKFYGHWPTSTTIGQQSTAHIEEEEEDEWSYEAFRVLIQKLHRLTSPSDASFVLFYTDPSDGDLLPISNNENFRVALVKSAPLVRVHVQRSDEITSNSPWSAKNNLGIRSSSLSTSKFFLFGGEEISGSYKPGNVKSIGTPRNFRHVSTLIDADQLPPSQRRVRLRKSPEDGRPLGFCIRDGWNLKFDDEGSQSSRSRGIFVSRLVPGGLAESTGLLAVNDEILEVNGISIAEGAKSLDQVTDMMVANACDLIITIKPQMPVDFTNTSSVGGTLRKSSKQNASGQQYHQEITVSVPSTPEGTLRRKKMALRSKRMEAASSVFYVDGSDDNEDTVINFVSSS